MESIIVLIIITVAAGSLALVAQNAKNKRDRTGEIIQRAAEPLGLKYRRGGMAYSPQASGHLQGRKVTIRFYTVPDDRGIEYIRIYVTHKLAAGGILMLTRETEYSRMQKKWRGEDILTGDRVFDDTLQINGSSPLHVSALMNGFLREKILSLVSRSENINLTSSWFEVLLNRAAVSPEDITAAARDVVDISLDMSRDDDFRGRLVGNIRDDGVAGVRGECLGRLMLHFPSDDEITGVLHGAMKDPALEVRIAAAKYLGAGGFEYLVQVLKEETDIGAEEAIGIIRHFGEHRFLGGIPVLKEMFTASVGKAKLLEILKAFRTMGEDGLSSYLLSYINYNEYDIRRGVIDALGSCGTVDAVEPLLKLAKSSLNPLLRSDVQKAVAEIQSRLGGADAGWLSVTETGGTEGALSMSGGAGEGALSGEETELKKKGVR